MAAIQSSAKPPKSERSEKKSATPHKNQPEVPEKVEAQNLVNCKNCGRHFASDRINTHEWICQRQKKRKPFDVCQQRVRGTDAEKFFKSTKSSKSSRSKSEKSTGAPPAKNWRKQHEEFINSMKAAREVTAHLKRGGNLKDLPPPPPSDYSDYIQCPHCLRKFNSTAAERHIPRCAEMQHNKPRPNAKTSAKSAPSKSGSSTRSQK